MKKIYLASALTKAPKDYKSMIEELRSKIKTQHQVFDYFGLGTGESQDVYEHDINCIDQSDLVVAEISHPALGVGFEIGYALSKHKKVLGIAKEGMVVGRMIRGITDPNFSFRTYKNTDEILELINNS